MSREEQVTWGKLYDQYAAVIYGAILQFTDDRTIAADIFCDIFIRLKNESFFTRHTSRVYTPLLKFTKKFTSIKMSELNPPPGMFVIY